MPNYFKQEEFACKCGCGLNAIDPKLVHMLNLTREHAGAPPGIPFVIDSACRCTQHNRDEGGVDDSAHTVRDDGLCHAVDVRAYSSATRFKIITSAMLHGFNRIGIGKTFIHLDNDASKPRNVVWLY